MDQVSDSTESAANKGSDHVSPQVMVKVIVAELIRVVDGGFLVLRDLKDDIACCKSWVETSRAKVEIEGSNCSKNEVDDKSLQ